MLKTATVLAAAASMSFGQVSIVSARREVMAMGWRASTSDTGPFYRTLALEGGCGPGIGSQQSTILPEALEAAATASATDGLNACTASASALYRVTFSVGAEGAVMTIRGAWSVERDTSAGNGEARISVVSATPGSPPVFDTRATAVRNNQRADEHLRTLLPAGTYTLEAYIQESAGLSPGVYGPYDADFYVLATFSGACPADFNGDGGIDGADVDLFFERWEAGDFAADVNFDGGIDGEDVSRFFDVWEAGGCG